MKLNMGHRKAGTATTSRAEGFLCVKPTSAFKLAIYRFGWLSTENTVAAAHEPKLRPPTGVQLLADAELKIVHNRDNENHLVEED